MKTLAPSVFSYLPMFNAINGQITQNLIEQECLFLLMIHILISWVLLSLGSSLIFFFSSSSSSWSKIDRNYKRVVDILSLNDTYFTISSDKNIKY